MSLVIHQVLEANIITLCFQFSCHYKTYPNNSFLSQLKTLFEPSLLNACLLTFDCRILILESGIVHLLYSVSGLAIVVNATKRTQIIFYTGSVE
jgi:hypothetical protein